MMTVSRVHLRILWTALLIGAQTLTPAGAADIPTRNPPSEDHALDAKPPDRPKPRQ